MPLTVRVALLTGWPSRLSASSAPVPLAAGTIACRPRAPAPGARRKVIWPLGLSKATAWKDEPLRPSIQVSSWRAEMTGTPRAFAASTSVSASGLSARSVHVRGDHAVEALRPQRAVEQRRRLGGDRLLGLVGELGCRLVGIDERPVRRGEAHR